MNKMTDGRFLMVAVFGAAVVGCGRSDGDNTPTGAEAQAEPSSIAERVVALNAKADQDMHIVARKYLNNNTEVAELYEPLPGHIVFSAAGSPLGSSVLQREKLLGKTASELWAYVAPGEPVPEALAQAIERSKTSAPVTQAPSVERPTGPQFGAPAPVSQTKGETLLSGGYCSSQFWVDWGSIGNGQNKNSGVFNWGFYDIAYNGVTSQAQYAACPQGNVSNLGGRLTVDWPDGTVSAWNLPPNYFRLSPIWTAGQSCGWDASCGNCNPFPFCQVGGTKCSPISFNINGRFDSQCFLNRGSSCGDNFDWISWASSQGSYCAN